MADCLVSRRILSLPSKPCITCQQTSDEAFTTSSGGSWILSAACTFVPLITSLSIS